VIEKDGVGLAVDDISEQFLLDAQVDYVKDLLSSSFRVVNNQAAEDACSCGVSFAPK
jgi:iron-sulfur cluster assembly accessory protein